MGFSYPWHRRRPVTSTGRRERPPSTPSDTTLAASSRLTLVRNESGVSYVAVLNRLIDYLKKNEVPGPQLFRLEKEFSRGLGEGGQGNVRGINKESVKLYKEAGKRIATRWPVELIAIKQHQAREIERQTHECGPHVQKVDAQEQDLASRLRAAECEVLALSPSLFRGHPNIVQLVGWGLCLDTIENSESKCCGSVQIPLLVLERAEMNLHEFLQVILQEISTSNAQDEEQCVGIPDMRLEPGRPRPLTSGWSIFAQWTGFETDPYEIVRLLCIDIGHGLQGLHEKGFVHGDLKPLNVLVFKSNKRWIAKLCDFGCARGQVYESISADGTSQVRQLQKEQYLGTRSWLPPREEVERDHDYEGLQKCDIYVYGLVVWSSFCLRGNSPPQRPTWTEAEESIKQFARGWGNRRWFGVRIRHLLKSTMAHHTERGLTPWTHLYGYGDGPAKYTIPSAAANSFSGLQNGDDIRSTLSSAVSRVKLCRPTSPTKCNVQPPLKPAIKANYDTMSWWLWRAPSAPSLMVQNSETTSDAPRDSVSYSTESPQLILTNSSDLTLIEGYGPATSMDLSTDDIPFSPVLFKDDKRRKGVGQLFQDMKETLSSWSSTSNAIDLYFYARFRSRVPLEWWPTTQPMNMLEQALQAFPAVDICTLAWLCNGPIGKSEAQNLPANYATWRVVLDPDFLNDSERLDRFLLLLQFGAPVEKKIYQQPRPTSLRSFLSIFGRYIRRCRPPTVPIVLREICRRFDHVKYMEHISSATRNFMTGASHVTLSKDSTAAADLKWDRNMEAFLELLPQSSNTDGDREQRKGSTKRKLPLSGIPEAISEEGGQSDESRPLLAQNPLPLGWKEHWYKKHGRRRGGAMGKSCCFEEEFTQSITLTRPKVSLMKIRQVKIGFLDKGTGDVCHLDLASCVRPGMGVRNGKVFDRDVSARFPYYDEDWFTTEWNTEASQEDVLKSLREPWRITSFSIRIPQLGRALQFLRAALVLLPLLIILLAMVLVTFYFAPPYPPYLAYFSFSRHTSTSSKFLTILPFHMAS
jgi:serine/threonine protein kinase